MTTVRQLLTGTLRLINVVSANETPNDGDIELCLTSLDGLIDSMGNDINNIFTFSPTRFMLTPGKADYLLGPALGDDGLPTGADWVIERPMRIEEAKLIRFPTVNGDVISGGPSTLYMPIKQLSVYEYANIRMRDLPNNWPWQMFDNGQYPCRKLSFWPIPQESNAVELWLWAPLGRWNTLDDQINMPQGYLRYLRFKLAIEVAPEFGKDIPSTIIDAMREAQASVMSLNQQLPKAYPSQSGSSLSHAVDGVYVNQTNSFGSSRTF